MPIDTDTLSALASDYAKAMTSIRGRRVQRLLKREFAGADHVLVVPAGSGGSGVVGLSDSGAAFCATDGRGTSAAVVKWRYGSATALETRFDMLKDSLPAVGTRSLPLADFLRLAQLRAGTDGAATQARALLSRAFA